jgi:hypothetical protein
MDARLLEARREDGRRMFSDMDLSRGKVTYSVDVNGWRNR